MSIITDFIDYIRVQKRYSSRTVELYRDAIQRYYTYYYKETIPASEDELTEVLNRSSIRGFVAYSLNSGLNPRTLNLYLSALSSYCNYLIKYSIIESNPVKKVTRPKEAKKLPAFYSEEALSEYLEETPSIIKEEESDFPLYRNRIMLLLLYSSGMRRSEIVKLQAKEFDFTRKIFRITGKGDKIREIPIPSSVCKELLLYLERIKREFPNEENGNFFVTDKGKPIYPQFVNNVVKKELSGEAGFSGQKSPHILRHSLATHLLNNGADLNSIKEILGHSSLAATQVYTHNSFEQLKKIYLTAHPRAKKRR